MELLLSLMTEINMMLIKDAFGRLLLFVHYEQKVRRLETKKAQP
ncbi:hypothetical protein VSF3289_02291 [Vibrio scophthalmi]|uniref:Uncharacterized protein n=1 Tax=Vibrio scophthalmi TaxID=45658 RepID=A0A1E3WQG6_9VIBR|nr:hypothetical protein VSF3289_02291 [Vibrio scophthalmi]